jgi:nucleotide-binding universal stress UspA family protein
MPSDRQPAVVAYDGSAEAREAIRAAATLFAGRPLVIVSVWEPGLAQAMAPLRDPTGLGYGIATPAETEAIDEAQHEHAVQAADDGARFAREHGAVAEAVSATEVANLAETIAAIADERDACAIVVGSRGLGGIKARLLGSTSRDVLHRTRRPVLVVKAPE